MADYRDLAAALGGYGQDTGGITPDTLATLRNGKTASASDLLGMLKAIGSGSLSNLESLVRGGVAQIPGTAGDLEGLARMGINKAFGAGGVNVNSTPVMPTTTDILGMMPRVTATRPETSGMEELGGYMAPATAKVAGKAIKATEGMPVGMSIKDVGKGIFEDATKYHQKVPEIKSINVNKLKRMNAGEVADVSDEVAAKMDFSKPIQVSVFSDGELRIVDGHHRVAAAKKLGIQSLPVELQAINAKGATLNKLAQEATYPQQAALPTQYPLAPAGTRYEEFGGKLTYMTPDEFLQQVRPLKLDAESLDNIAALKRHVETGGKLDPLHIYASGKEDGRHRAYLAKELGIEKIPVAIHKK